MSSINKEREEYREDCSGGETTGMNKTDLKQSYSNHLAIKDVDDDPRKEPIPKDQDQNPKVSEFQKLIDQAIKAIVTYETLSPQIGYTRTYQTNAIQAERFIRSLSVYKYHKVWAEIHSHIVSYYDSLAPELNSKS